MDKLILVDEQDSLIGEEEKLEAHRRGLLHRAFSVFIFNSQGMILLQKRAEEKYHSGGLWTNTCCSHPNPGEETLWAARRRLKEEMGIECELREVYKFIYKTEFENGLTEYEYDHVFMGEFGGNPMPDKNEVSDWKWVDKDWLKRDIKNNPENYTYWFKDCYGKVLKNVEGL